jgi:hypothetical protein
MEKAASSSKLLLYQSAGFLAIIGLSWLDELIGLPALVLQDHPYISNFHESTLEMLLVLAVWLLVSSATRRLIGHVQYLSGFMRVCAWCRRIFFQGRWIRLEEFMKRGFDTPTSHGICADCMQEESAALERSRQAAGRTSAAKPRESSGTDAAKA